MSMESCPHCGYPLTTYTGSAFCNVCGKIFYYATVNDKLILVESLKEKRNTEMKHKCHNYQPACNHKDCNTCEDWWYSEADTGRFAEKGR